MKHLRTLRLAGLAAAFAALASTASAVTLFTTNFDTIIGSQNLGPASASTTAIPGFTVYTTVTSAVNQTTSSQVPQLSGSTAFGRAQTAAGNYVALVGAAFTATADASVFNITVDFAERLSTEQGGRYLIGFLENWNGTRTGASVSGTSSASFSLGGTNGTLLGVTELQKSSITPGSFVGGMGTTASYSATVGSSVRAVIIFDNTAAALASGHFDNFSLTATAAAVPEPASFAALAGLGALGLVAARRRRAA